MSQLVKIQLSDTPEHRALDSGDTWHDNPIAFIIPGYLHALVELPEGWTDTQIEGFLRPLADAGEIITDPNGFYWRHEKTYEVLGVEARGAVMAVGDTFPLHGLNEETWRRGKYGEGATIAVLDTGADTRHNFFHGIDVTGDLNDGHGHGTHVATTAGGIMGAAPKARLRIFKVLSDQGSGPEFGIANGIRAAADEGCDVISMSLGGGGSQVIDDACQYAIARFSIVVSAAGNGGSRVPLGSPARASSLIVMACDRGDQWAGFTDGLNSSDLRRIGANGVGIDAARAGTVDGITSMSGTSMATPFISGVAANLKASGKTADETVTYILSHRQSPPSAPGKVFMLADFGAVPTPPPEPTPEPEPYPPIEIAPGIWDGRSAVSNPLGRGPMGTLEGQATHHTVTAIVQVVGGVRTAEQLKLGADALLLGKHLAFDASIEQELAHIRAIDAYHKSLGWGGFAYHGIAYLSGRSWLCGNLDGQRAHVADMNDRIHGLAFNGDYTSVLPADSMLRAGGNFLKYVRRETGSGPLPIKGHREWGTATACPGVVADIDWAPYLDEPGPPTGKPAYVSSIVLKADSTGEIRFAGDAPLMITIHPGEVWPVEYIDVRLAAEIAVDPP